MDLAVLLIVLGVIGIVLGYTVLPFIFVTLGAISLGVGVLLYVLPYLRRPPR